MPEYPLPKCHFQVEWGGTKIGFTEHKVDQAWIIDRGQRIDKRRIDDAYAFVRDKGAFFAYAQRIVRLKGVSLAEFREGEN